MNAPVPQRLEDGAPVLLVAHSQYRAVYIGVARRLHETWGCPIHLYVTTAQEADFYRKRHPDLFASITVERALYAACQERVTDPEAAAAEARANERDLGVTYGELAVADRHLGRGFALGGFRHPRSRISENTDYAGLLHGYNRVIAFWRAELDAKHPALVLNAGKVLSVLARSRGIPTRVLAGSRYRTYYYWAVNEFFEPAADLTLPPADDDGAGPAMDEPYAAYTSYRKQFEKDIRLLRTVRRMLSMGVRHAYWRLRGYDKAKVYFLRENLGFVWRQRQATLAMTAPRLPTLDSVRGRPFVFFPLAAEPEAALQHLSPEYLSQLACITSICRDLPAGYLLVVKEHHTGVGRRPRDFYRQIAEFKNVRFIDMNEPGLDVVREAAAVATISGTAGLEAAVLGKPVIAFGRHNLYRHLPHVYTVTDEVQLKEYLRRALLEPHPQAKADGQRFLRAIFAMSFDLGAFSPWKPDVIGEAELEAAVRSLVASLPADARSAAPPATPYAAAV